MSNTGKTVPKPLLIAERDPEDRFGPGPALVAARESATWPQIDFSLPQYPNLGELHAWAVTTYHDVREILSHENVISGLNGTSDDPDAMANQPGFLVHLNGEDHLRLRRILNLSFTAKRSHALRPRIEEMVTDLLDEMERKGSPGDVYRDFAAPLPSLVICELLGVPFEDHAEFEEWTHALTNLTSTPERARWAKRSMHDYMAELIEKARKEPGEDLLSAWVTEHGDQMSDEETIGLAMMVLVGGHDTTANLIALSTVALLQHPDQLAAVRDDDSIIDGAVEELIRICTPVAMPPNRLATADITIGQNSMRAGERALASLIAANSDPELVGDNPGLDVRRKKTAHVGFGYGRHQCPGQHLARVEMAIAMPALLRRFPAMRQDAPMEELGFRPHTSVYGIAKLPIAW